MTIAVKLKYLSILLITIILCASCDDENERIPFVPVDFELNLTLPAYAPLQTVGNWIYITGGSQGIIVYRFSIDEFRAWDRHCTLNVPDNCRIEVDNSNIQAEDNECCQSVFSIIDGSVQSGDAFVPLQGYSANLFGNNLRITN